MAEATTVIDRNTVINEFNKLINLGYDAIAAYDAAIERVISPEYREHLREFKIDHERQTRHLTAYVKRFGGKAATQGDIRRVLSKGIVILGNINHDKGVLEAMKSNENQTNRFYEEALQRLGDEPEVADMLLRNLEDERRHRLWLVSTLDAIVTMATDLP